MINSAKNKRPSEDKVLNNPQERKGRWACSLTWIEPSASERSKNGLHAPLKCEKEKPTDLGSNPGGLTYCVSLEDHHESQEVQKRPHSSCRGTSF